LGNYFKLLIEKYIKGFTVEAVGVPVDAFHVPGRFSGEVGYDKDDVYLPHANGFRQWPGKPQMSLSISTIYCIAVIQSLYQSSQKGKYLNETGQSDSDAA
jgi:hypothetical protein